MKICLHVIYSNVQVDKRFSDSFPNGRNKEILYYHCFSSLVENLSLGRYKKTGGGWVGIN